MLVRFSAFREESDPVKNREAAEKRRKPYHKIDIRLCVHRRSIGKLFVSLIRPTYIQQKKVRTESQ